MIVSSFCNNNAIILYVDYMLDLIDDRLSE